MTSVGTPCLWCTYTRNERDHVNAKGTPLRNFRIDDDLWEAAAEVASKREESLSGVIRQLLDMYVSTEGAVIDQRAAGERQER